MKGILADRDVLGYVQILLNYLQADPFRFFWEHLNLTCYTFDEVGLVPEDADLVVWNKCQEMSLVLITGIATTMDPIPFKTRSNPSIRHPASPYLPLLTRFEFLKNLPMRKGWLTICWNDYSTWTSFGEQAGITFPEFAANIALRRLSL